MALVRPRLTEFHGIFRPQVELDFAIPILDEDVPLYVDPFLLWKSPSYQDKALHRSMVESFNAIGHLARRAKRERGVEQLLIASECDEVGLGVSATLERLVGQLDGVFGEISALAKKSPNDAVNKFKIKFINRVLGECNNFLNKKYKPLADFSAFEEDDVPSNSDVTFIVNQYMQAVERFRADNIRQLHGMWYYRTREGVELIRTAPPSKIIRK
jgi:hypothetical protein